MLAHAHVCSRMQIRLEFEKLVETNAALPPAEQLTHEEFEVDPDLRLLLEKEAADKVEEARKELQVSACVCVCVCA